jgi:hypothetical protein
LLFCLFAVLNSPCQETSKHAIKNRGKPEIFGGTIPIFFSFGGMAWTSFLLKTFCVLCFVCIFGLLYRETPRSAIKQQNETRGGSNIRK